VSPIHGTSLLLLLRDGCACDGWRIIARCPLQAGDDRHDVVGFVRMSLLSNTSLARALATSAGSPMLAASRRLALRMAADQDNTRAVLNAGLHEHLGGSGAKAR
jgi:hypothetical protein